MQTIHLVFDFVKQRDLMNKIDTTKPSKDAWKFAREDMYSSAGPLNAFRQFEDKSKRTQRFKKHIREMVEIGNKSFANKQSKGIAPLLYEAEGRELYDTLQAAELKLKRKIDENKRQKAENVARQARLRVINNAQGLVPPVPVYTQPPTQQPTQQSTVQRSQQPVRPPSQNPTRPPVQQTRQPAQQQAQLPTQLPATQPRGQIRTPNNRATATAERPSQRRRGNMINPPRGGSQLVFDDENVPDEFRNQIRQPHNETPTNRHRDMIDRIDMGNTITQQAMTQLTTVLNNDRQNADLNFGNVIGLIAATATSTNDDDGYQNVVRRAYEVAHKIIDGHGIIR